MAPEEQVCRPVSTPRTSVCRALRARSVNLICKWPTAAIVSCSALMMSIRELSSVFMLKLSKDLPSAIISALRPSPAAATATVASSRAPGGGGAGGGRGALVTGRTPRGRRLVQAVGQMRQLAESRIPVRKGRRRVWRGRGAPMLLVLVVGVLEVRVRRGSRVVLGQGRRWSDLGREVSAEPGADMV
ncbi:hypothetical protein EYF80_000945 [Liparis tanakae]|uniref:Uncharacterized protein n=1 Tax=Liparis tanakae TaxID=230148 RepID=A0A4Z2JFL8_9TELE|nr:hypothetical protein EYF80_000945 [Liparis tanakae]